MAASIYHSSRSLDSVSWQTKREELEGEADCSFQNENTKVSEQSKCADLKVNAQK